LKYPLYWTVERIEKFAISAAPQSLSASQPQQSAIRTRDGFLDKPPVAANVDDIAGGERRRIVFGHAAS
jgi:hypothetical protein